MIKVHRSRSNRIAQGDVIRDVAFIESIDECKGVVEFSKIVFPLVVVLTQDCDLEQDQRARKRATEMDVSKRNHDKFLFAVLVAPLYNVEHFIAGEHYSLLGNKMREFSKKPEASERKTLSQNEIPRYHFIEFPTSIPVINSVVDFKHTFSVSIDYLNKLKRKNFICQLSDLYREDVSQRFASYLSRIGLPTPKVRSPIKSGILAAPDATITGNTDGLKSSAEFKG